MVDWISEAFPRLRRFGVAGLEVRSTMFVGGGSVWDVIAWDGLLAIAEGCVGGGFGSARKFDDPLVVFISLLGFS